MLEFTIQDILIKYKSCINTNYNNSRNLIKRPLQAIYSSTNMEKFFHGKVGDDSSNCHNARDWTLANYMYSCLKSLQLWSLWGEKESEMRNEESKLKAARRECKMCNGTPKKGDYGNFDWLEMAKATWQMAWVNWASLAQNDMLSLVVQTSQNTNTLEARGAWSDLSSSESTTKSIAIPLRHDSEDSDIKSICYQLESQPKCNSKSWLISKIIFWQ